MLLSQVGKNYLSMQNSSIFYVMLNKSNSGIVLLGHGIRQLMTLDFTTPTVVRNRADLALWRCARKYNHLVLQGSIISTAGSTCETSG